MFSEAFVGSSSRLTSASSFCTVVCLAFALVVAGPPPLRAGAALRAGCSAYIADSGFVGVAKRSQHT